MKALSELFASLSVELQGHLLARAARLEVPVEWLVAGLVCDAIESCPSARKLLGSSIAHGATVGSPSRSRPDADALPGSSSEVHARPWRS